MRLHVGNQIDLIKKKMVLFKLLKLKNEKKTKIIVFYFFSFIVVHFYN